MRHMDFSTRLCPWYGAPTRLLPCQRPDYVNPHRISRQIRSYRTGITSYNPRNVGQNSPWGFDVRNANEQIQSQPFRLMSAS